MAEPLLRCRDLTFGISGSTLVDAVSLELAAGEICGLVGPNGAGKTTLLNLIGGALRSQSGTLEVDGRDITRAPAHARRRHGISRTFQLVRGIEDATARANVLVGLYAAEGDRRLRMTPAGRRSAAAAVDEALRRVAVEEFADWPFGLLSYGSRKKVELARCIVGQPRLVLLDEPTAGVSLAHVRAFESTIRDLAERGCGVLVIDHDLQFVSRIAKRVVVLDAGETIFDGAPADAFSDPAVVDAYIGRVAPEEAAA